MANWILAGATIVLAIITIYYAWRTHRLSDAADKQVKLLKDTIDRSLHPYISFEANSFIDGEANRIFINNEIPTAMKLTALNAGKGPAINISIQCLSDSEYESYNEGRVPFTDYYEEKILSLLKSDDTKQFEFRIQPQDVEEVHKAKYLVLIAKYDDELGQRWQTTQFIRIEEYYWLMREIEQHRIPS